MKVSKTSSFKVKFKAFLPLLCVFSLTFAEGTLLGKHYSMYKGMHEREQAWKDKRWEDKIKKLKDFQHPSSSSREYSVVYMRKYQEMQTNPNIYWAFHSAFQGLDEYGDYVRAKKSGKLKSFILKTASQFKIRAGVGIKGVGGIGVSFPLIPEELTEKFSNSWALDSDPYMPHLSEMATLATNMSFGEVRCQDLGVPCPDPQQKIDLFDPEIYGGFNDRGALFSAMAVAKRESSTWPESTDLQYLEKTFPKDVAVVSAMQTEKNSEKILNIMEEQTRFMHEERTNREEQKATETLIKYNPAVSQEDKVISELQAAQDTFEKRRKEVDTQIKELPPGADEKSKELVAKRESFKQKIAATEKAKKFYKHKKDCARASAWVGAVTSLGQAVGAPPIVIKTGIATNIGITVFDAAKSMFLSGTLLDPTGITTIANGVSALVRIFSGVPSTEEVMIKKLDEIRKNQKEMLANQKKLLEGQQKILAGQRKILDGQNKILKTLDKMEKRILAKFDELENILSKNHQEILAGQQDILDSIESLHTDMLAGFERIEQKEYTNRITTAKSLYAEYYNNPGSSLQQSLSLCQRDDSYCESEYMSHDIHSKVKEHLGNMGIHFKHPTNQYSVTDRNFFNIQSKASYSKDEAINYKAHGYTSIKKEKKAIQTLLNAPLQSRIPYLYSMMLWLEDQLQKFNEESIKKESDTDAFSHVAKTAVAGGLNWEVQGNHFNALSLIWQNPDLKPLYPSGDSNTVESNTPLSDKEAFRQTKINNPALQDELFAEAVNLNMVLPDKRTEIVKSKQAPLYDDIPLKLEYSYITPICKTSQATDNMAWVMRANLSAAWKIYMKHHLKTTMFFQDYNENRNRDIRLKFKLRKRYAPESHKIPGIWHRETSKYFIVQTKSDLENVKETYKLNRKWGYHRTCKQPPYYTRYMNRPYNPSYSHLSKKYGHYKKSFTIGENSRIFVELQPSSSGEFDMIFTLNPSGVSDINHILTSGKTYKRYIKPVFEHPLFDYLAIKQGYYKEELVQYRYFLREKEGYHSEAVCEKGDRSQHWFLLPRKEKFIKEQRRHWLKQVWMEYRKTLRKMNKKNDNALFVDFMKAHLMFDTMLKIGYGKLLDSHPDLQYLKKLVRGMGENMQKVPKLKDITNTKDRVRWRDIKNEWKSISSFLKKGEKVGNFTYYDWLVNLTDTKTEDWVHPPLWPECESHKDRLEFLILHIKKKINRLQTKNQNLQTKFKENMVGKPAKAIENEAQITRWENTLNDLLDQDEDSPLIQGDQNQLTNLNIYHKWKHPLCGSTEDNNNIEDFRTIVKAESTLDDFYLEANADFKYRGNNLQPELPLISEENWRGQAVGWGRPDIRQKAFQKARMYDHINLKECHIME